MNSSLNRRFGWLLLLACALLAPRAGAAGDGNARDGRPLAILMYAEWCANCKMIVPRLAELESAYDGRIRFERLDVSSAETKVGARQKARNLGVLRTYFANKGTGLVALIDRRREKVGELRVGMSDEEMRAALDALASGAEIPAPASQFAVPVTASPAVTASTTAPVPAAAAP